MRRWRIPALLIALLVWGIAFAQLARFEVAAIKPSAPGGTPGGEPGGVPMNFCAPPFGSGYSQQRYVLLNCTVRDLVGRAWNLRSYEFSVPADPPWFSTAHYDINAKSAPVAHVKDHERMLQSLLEDRFRLKWHREKRELPVYILSVAKGGIKLRATAPGICVPWDKKSPPPGPSPDKPPTCDYMLMPQTPDGLGFGLDGTGVLMYSLAERLTGLLGRPVVDKTAVSGAFDLHLKFARDSSLMFGNRTDQPGQASEPSGLTNIFTAIRATGLNIESGKGPVDVFVIDSVQRPSEN